MLHLLLTALSWVAGRWEEGLGYGRELVPKGWGNTFWDTSQKYLSLRSFLSKSFMLITAPDNNILKNPSLFWQPPKPGHNSQTRKKNPLKSNFRPKKFLWIHPTSPLPQSCQSLSGDPASENTTPVCHFTWKILKFEVWYGHNSNADKKIP